jgi:hypothetical protein
MTNASSVILMNPEVVIRCRTFSFGVQTFFPETHSIMQSNSVKKCFRDVSVAILRNGKYADAFTGKSPLAFSSINSKKHQIDFGQ